MIKKPINSLGDPLIDRQHADLFASLRQIGSLHERRLDDEKVIDHLTRISEQLRQHFLSEEALMKRVSVPPEEIARHQAEHLRILEELAQLHFNIMQGRVNWVADVFGQISNWVAGHVEAFDAPLGDYIARATHH